MPTLHTGRVVLAKHPTNCRRRLKQYSKPLLEGSTAAATTHSPPLRSPVHKPQRGLQSTPRRPSSSSSTLGLEHPQPPKGRRALPARLTRPTGARGADTPPFPGARRDGLTLTGDTEAATRRGGTVEKGDETDMEKSPSPQRRHFVVEALGGAGGREAAGRFGKVPRAG